MDERARTCVCVLSKVLEQGSRISKNRRTHKGLNVHVVACLLLLELLLEHFELILQF